jgi:hypothetical protein
MRSPRNSHLKSHSPPDPHDSPPHGVPHEILHGKNTLSIPNFHLSPSHHQTPSIVDTGLNSTDSSIPIDGVHGEGREGEGRGTERFEDFHWVNGEWSGNGWSMGRKSEGIPSK